MVERRYRTIRSILGNLYMKHFTIIVTDKGDIEFSGNMSILEANTLVQQTLLTIAKKEGKKELLREQEEKKKNKSKKREKKEE